MRKYCTLLVVLLVLSAAGCATQNVTPANPTDTANPTTQAAAETQGWQALPTFDTLEAYNEYIADRTNPKTFLTYEDIKMMGGFVCFVDLGYPKCQKYLYGLIDENGYHITLSIYPINKSETNSNVSEYVQPASEKQDMRTTSSNAQLLAVNGVRYTYYEGNLQNISWDTDSHRFIIEQCRTEPLSVYPENKYTSLLQQLLNAGTAEAAVAEFNAKVAQARAEKAD